MFQDKLELKPADIIPSVRSPSLSAWPLRGLRPSSVSHFAFLVAILKLDVIPGTFLETT